MKLITRKNLFPILWISLGLNLFIALFFIGKRIYYSFGSSGDGAGKPGQYDYWDKARTDVYNALPIDSTDIVFVGNSLTEGFPVTEIFGTHVKNRGIGGNTTSNVLNRIEQIAIQKPKKIFIEIGINDLNIGICIDSAFNNYIAILNKIKTISPRTIVFAQSIFPTCKNYEKLMPQVVDLNSKIAAYCGKHAIHFINLYHAMLLENALDSTLTYDGIHLNAKGYHLWEKRIAPMVN